MLRTIALIDAEAATTATTKTLDIDVNAAISSIVIEFKGTNNGHVPTAHPAKMITKIELVDGAETLLSVSGREAEAAYITNTGKRGYSELNYQNNVLAIIAIPILFGRWIGDKLLGFDPRQFKNPQLKITHNKALGGSVPDAGTISVFASIFVSEDVKPVGMLSLKQIKSYALTSSAEERTALPVDQAIRRLMISSLYAGKQPWEQYNKVKLTADTDKVVFLNGIKTSDLLKFMPGNPHIVESVRVTDVDAETTVYVTSGYDAHNAGNGLGASEVTLFFDECYGGSVDMTAGAAGAVDFLSQGKAPHGTLNIPMGDANDIESWFDPTEFKKVETVLTAGSSVGGSSTAEQTLETLRKY